jgi:hypothetical protein
MPRGLPYEDNEIKGISSGSVAGHRNTRKGRTDPKPWSCSGDRPSRQPQRSVGFWIDQWECGPAQLFEPAHNGLRGSTGIPTYRGVTRPAVRRRRILSRWVSGNRRACLSLPGGMVVVIKPAKAAGILNTSGPSNGGSGETIGNHK